ncbi:MAG: 50S ribosomal protein L35 [Chloroflexi bacterium]|nr:50S ribosomal protein L35 [Chloroflexota bacterium]
MPKIKTHKGAQARFHITGTGKLMRIKGPKSHLRSHKAKRVKGLFDSKIPVSAVDRARLKRLLPYGV